MKSCEMNKWNAKRQEFSLHIPATFLHGILTTSKVYLQNIWFWNAEKLEYVEELSCCEYLFVSYLTQRDRGRRADVNKIWGGEGVETKMGVCLMKEQVNQHNVSCLYHGIVVSFHVAVWKRIGWSMLKWK